MCPEMRGTHIIKRDFRFFCNNILLDYFILGILFDIKMDCFSEQVTVAVQIPF